jgi:uncharacterized protein (DUF302 family)
VAGTVAVLRDEIESRGASVVAVVDHAAAARAVGLEMPDTQVLIFGNPRAGTPLMLAAPDIALDLPLRVLVRDDGDPGSLVAWQEPDFVADRFGLPADVTARAPLRAVAAIVAAALAR